MARGITAWNPAILEKELQKIKLEENIKSKRWRSEAAAELVHRARVGGGLIRNDWMNIIPGRKANRRGRRRNVR